MPRPRKGPRLYLRHARGDRSAVYVIIDGSREIGTGCGPDRAREAEAALAEYLAAKHCPPPARGRALDDILIADVMAAYLREHAPTTARPEFLAATAKPILAWWGDRSLADVRAAACRDYVASRTQAVSLATARHDLKTLRAAINYYHAAHGPLPAVPAVTMPSAPEPRDRWLTRDEAARMLRAALRSKQSRHIARLILIGLYSGTRSGAMLALRWLPSTDGGWVDLGGGVIHRRAKGSRQSRKRQPPVAIHDRLRPHLARWQRLDEAGVRYKGEAAELAAGKLGPRAPITHVVHYYGQRVTKLRRSWEAVRKAAGLGADVVPHTLRHTAATWQMQWGTPRHEAAGFLGMTAETLEQVYGHHDPRFQRTAASAGRRERQPGTKGDFAQGTPKKPSSTAVTERHPAAPKASKSGGLR